MNVIRYKVSSASAVLSFIFACTSSMVAQSSFTFVPGVSRVAGTGTAGSPGTGGLATSVAIRAPRGAVLDTRGNLYFSDNTNNTMDRVDAITGQLTIVAGGGTVCAAATDAYGDGCPATQATLNAPDQLALDAAGNVYIADFGNNLVRKLVVATGQIVKVAGGGTVGAGNCTGSTDTVGDGCLATAAAIDQPQGLAVDGAGNIYESDSLKNLVRRIDAKTGIISKYAGNGTAGLTGDGAAAVSARLSAPAGLVLDAAGNLYIADKKNSLIRFVNATTLVISTVAGTNNGSAAVAGYAGDGGAATSATLNTPTGVALGPQGNLYIADYGNNVVRVVSPKSVITTAAGGGTACSTGDTLGNGCAATQTKLSAPYALAVDAGASLVIADFGGNEVRKLSLGNDFGLIAISGAAGTRELFAQASAATTPKAVSVTPSGEFALASSGALSGCTLGTAVAANAVCGVNGTFAPQYPGLRSGVLSITDASGANASIGLRGVGVAAQTGFSRGLASTVAGSGTAGNANGNGTAAQFSGDTAVAVDSAGNLYVADRVNSQIRLITPAGDVTRVAGASSGTAGYAGDGGVATSALLNTPQAVVVDYVNGRTLVADTGNNVVRAISASNVISTLIGTGAAGYTGDGAAASSATLRAPGGVAVDYVGNVYVSDSGNNVIRKIDLNGSISTIAGTGTAGYTGDGGAATAATLNAPAELAVDVLGNLYIAESGNHVVRKIALATNVISTVAGNGVSGYSGDGGAATSATLKGPRAVAVDAAGELLIADSVNNVVRLVNAAGVISTLGGTGTAGYAGDGTQAIAARFNAPGGIAVDGGGNAFVADTGNNVVRRIAVGDTVTVSFAQQAVGTTSAPQNVTVSNTGNAALSFTSAAVTGPFSLTSGGTCGTATPVAPGLSCTFLVTFTPTSSGSASGTLKLVDNGIGGTQILPLVYADNGAATTSTLMVSPAATSQVYGVTLTLAGQVTAPATNASAYNGPAIFVDGSASLATATVDSNGAASYSLVPGAGLHKYAFSFLGDSGHSPSQSAVTQITITQASSATTLSANPTSIQLGSTVTLRATVTPQAGGVATGLVNFTSGGVTLGSASVTNGAASITVTTLPMGTDSVTATYSGDLNVEGSTSATATVTVLTIPGFSLTAAPAALTIAAGQSGVVAFTLTPVYGYTGTITLACGSVPTNVQCHFLPAMLNAAGNNLVLNTQLLLTTGGASASQAGVATSGGGWLMMFALSPLVLLLYRTVRQRRAGLWLYAVPLLFFCVLTSGGCGSSSVLPAKAATGTSTVVVTATGSSGGVVHTVNVAVTIQ